MTAHYNELTPAQAERLAMLSEECGEIVQMVGKILRHGYESCHPADQHQTPNRDHLDNEIADLVAIVVKMSNSGDIGPLIAHIGNTEKIWARKLRYTHHQERV